MIRFEKARENTGTFVPPMGTLSRGAGGKTFPTPTPGIAASTHILIKGNNNLFELRINIHIAVLGNGANNLRRCFFGFLGIDAVYGNNKKRYQCYDTNVPNNA